MKASSSAPVRVRRRAWWQLQLELRRRGELRREAGAFLLGHRRRLSAVVTDIAYFDDLEPTSLNGAVHLTTVGYAQLWKKCRELGVEVLADVHTHPGQHVGQSSIDQENPLIAQRGHVAIIVPNFAGQDVGFDAVGVYGYHGDDGWRTEPSRLRHRRLWR